MDGEPVFVNAAISVRGANREGENEESDLRVEFPAGKFLSPLSGQGESCIRATVAPGYGTGSGSLGTNTTILEIKVELPGGKGKEKDLGSALDETDWEALAPVADEGKPEWVLASWSGKDEDAVE